MPTTRETILQSLHTLLQTLPATALRGEVLPERVPPEGLMILRDGDPGDPEFLLSPLLYLYDHRAEIEVVVQAGDPTARDVALDTVLASIGVVPVYDVAAVAAQIPIDEVLKDYPSLSADQVDLAKLYAKANPLRGRPKMVMAPPEKAVIRASYKVTRRAASA